MSLMNRLGASENPILQVAGLLVGAVVTVGAILLGAVVLSLALGLALLIGLVIYVRLWWLQRRMPWAAPRGRNPEGEIVGAEYRVVRERAVDDREGD